MSIGFSLDVEVDPRLDGGDDDGFDGFAHYAPKEGLVEAMIYGTKVVALCGHKFVPMRDPEKHPVCPRCKAIYEMLSNE